MITKNLSFANKFSLPVVRHINLWHDCTRCEIGRIADHHCFGRGVLPCEILFIGEAPGKTEDCLGSVFIGQSGTVLDSWIHRAQKVLGFQVPYAITNTVLCRPCDGMGQPNRAPTDEEKKNCAPRLREFMALANPEGVVFIGNHSRDLLAGTLKLPSMALLHPAYVLRKGRDRAMEDDQVAQLVRFIRKVERR